MRVFTRITMALFVFSSGARAGMEADQPVLEKTVGQPSKDAVWSFCTLTPERVTIVHRAGKVTFTDTRELHITDNLTSKIRAVAIVKSTGGAAPGKGPSFRYTAQITGLVAPYTYLSDAPNGEIRHGKDAEFLRALVDRECGTWTLTQK